MIIETAMEGLSENTAKARAMLRSGTLVRDFAAEHFLTRDKPLPGILKQRFPDAVRLGRESVPDLGVPAFALEFPVQVLEDRVVNGVYRYVISLRREALRKATTPALYGEPDNSEISLALRATWERRERTAQLEEMCRSFSLPVDLLRLTHAKISESFPGAPWYRLPKLTDARTLAERWKRTERLLTDTGAEAEAIREIVQNLPLPREAMTFFHTRAEGAGDTEAAILWRLWGDGVAKFAEINNDFKDVEFNKWLELVGRLATSDAATAPITTNDTLSAVRWSWHCAGFSDCYGLSEASPENLITASRLYDKGRNVERIIALAATATDEAPGNAACWSMLGRAFLASGKPVQAGVFLTQALLLSPADAENRIFLAMAYQQTGCVELAHGMAASALFACGEGTEWSRGKAMAILND